MAVARFRPVLVLLLVVASGCWFQAGGGPGRTGYNALATEITTANVANLGERWTASAGVGGEPLVSGGIAYVRGGGTVTALRLDTGGVVWSTPGLNGGAEPVIFDGQLHVPRNGGACSLASLDLSTGAVVGSEGFGLPDLNGFAGGSSSCSITSEALEVDSKVIVSWNYFGIVPTPGCLAGAWAIGPGVTALDQAPTAESWERRDVLTGCGSPPTSVPPAFGASSSDGTVALFARGATLDATPVDCPSSCGGAWSADLGSPIVGPAIVLATVDPDHLTTTVDFGVPTEDGRVVVIDGATRQVEWTGTLGAPPTDLAASGTTIFAGTSDGTVAAFPRGGCGASTCAPDWTAAVGAPVSERSTIAGGILYVGADNGTVSAFAADGCGAATCDALWVGSTPARIASPPVVDAGVVLVRSDDGTVTAFALPDHG